MYKDIRMEGNLAPLSNRTVYNMQWKCRGALCGNHRLQKSDIETFPLTIYWHFATAIYYRICFSGFFRKIPN